MISKRTLARLLTAVGLFGCGALGLIAVFASRPACAVVAVLVALGLSLWPWRSEPVPMERPAPAPDIDLHHAQEHRRRLLEALLDQAPTPLLMVTEGAPMSAMNRASRRLFRTSNAILQPEAELQLAIAAAHPGLRSTLRLCLAGRQRTFTLSVADVTGQGPPVRLASLTDIQPEMLSAEAAALKEMLQVLSHEIMNTLTPVASLAESAVELLREGGGDEHRLALEAVEVIARRTSGLHRFVEAYRQLARLPEPRPRDVSVTAVLKEAAKLFGTTGTVASGVRLVVGPPRPDIIVRMDPDLCVQALLNLLANAVHAARSSATPEVILSAESAGDGARILVRDNGLGVDPALAADIFRPFFTTKSGGTGVGLSIARQAILAQGGELRLMHLDPGACFAIDF